MRRDGRTGSIRGNDLAGFGGHDLDDPQPTVNSGALTTSAGWAVQSTDVVITQPVEDQFELSSGRSHRTDIAVTAAMSHPFADRADAAGVGQDLHRFDGRPAHQARALLGDPATVVSDSRWAGVSPAHQVNWAGPAKRATSPISATNTAASTGPMPGICWIAV